MNPNPSPDRLPATAAPSGLPDVAALINEFKLSSPFTGSNWNRVRLNEDIRFTRWENQWPDGKKRNSSRGKAFPWEGASDARCPAADEMVNWVVAECWESFRRALMAPKAGVTETSNYAVKLLDYLVNTVLYEPLYECELELSAQYRETYGWCALHPTWEVELDLEYREVQLEVIVAAAQQAQQQLAQAQARGLGQMLDENVQNLARLPELIHDPSQEEAAVEILAIVYGQYAKSQLPLEVDLELPPVRPERLRQAVQELRASGVAKLPVPYVCKNQPAIYALKPWDEIFIRGSLTDVQHGLAARRVWMTEAEVRAKILTAHWNPRWVEQAVKLKGKVSAWTTATGTNPPTDLSLAMGAQDSTVWQLVDANPDLIEVLFCTYKQLDADGVPGVYLTVIHPSIGGAKSELALQDTFAEHGLLEGAGGQMPYVIGTRERWNRAIATSRGLPEVVNTWQRTIKTHTDGAIDWMSLGVLPPINIYDNAMGTQYVLGPAVQNTVRLGKEPKFAEVPSKGVPLVFEMVKKTELDMDAYAGRDNPELVPGRGQSKRQKSIGSFLLMWTKALQMTLNLCQQFMPDAEFSRVTGAPEGWLDQNRSTRNALAARLEFDIRELSPEYVQSQLQAINQLVIPGDVAGLTNRSKLTEVQWRMINPILARELVQEQSEASQKLFEKVQSDVALMFLGNEPQYVEMDPSAKQKLQYAQQIVSANPNYLQALQAGQGRFVELMQKYSQNLQFSLVEEQNKMVGRIGVQPGPSQMNQGGNF